MSATEAPSKEAPHKLSLRCFGETDVGRVRQNNEDNFLMLPERCVFAVADGMGGAKAGEVASQMAVESLSDQSRSGEGPSALYDPADPEGSSNRLLDWVTNAIRKSHKSIWKRSQKEASTRGMGCTLDLLVLSADRAFVGHIGDSRIYLIRRSRAYRVTQDHTLAQAQFAAGVLTEAELKTARTRNILLKAMGVQTEVEPDIFSFDIAAGDRFLLCSDGLYEYIADGEIAPLFDELPLDKIPRRLIEMACERGGHDNITAVVVEIGGAPQASEAEAALLVEALAALPVAEHLSARELGLISRIGALQKYSAGDLILVEGEDTERLCLVIEGEVCEGDPSKERLAREGDTLGVGALVSERPAPVSLRALRDATVFLVERGAFQSFLGREPDVAQKLLWSFLSQQGDRLRRRAIAYTQTEAKR
jgi:serine/threonine protein phosphatase PrpC